MVFVDGAFDMTHLGHMNAFRLARELGQRLVVGVNSTASITECKAPPIMTDFERQEMVKACRFVDEIIPCSPYIMSPEYIAELQRSHGVGLFVHGDDPCIVDGRDVYEAVKKAGMFETIRRTEGISTTDIVGRLLLATKSHHVSPQEATTRLAGMEDMASSASCFPVTWDLLRAFSPKPNARPAGGTVVYVAGAWDLLHPGHVSVLRQARGLGDFLVVGIYSDHAINEDLRANFPLMSLHERVLGVLGLRYVDDVLFNAPKVVTQEMLTILGVSLVVEFREARALDPSLLEEWHREPRAQGILREVTSEVDLTVEDMTARLLRRRDELSARHEVKSRAEAEWFREARTTTGGPCDST